MAAEGTQRQRLVAIWRTMQTYDAGAWRKVRENAPMRTTRWLVAIGVVVGYWTATGAPHSAVTWLPALVIVLLLILPDADSVGLGAFTWKAQKQADRLEEATGRAAELTESMNVGALAGDAARASALSRDEPAVRAGQDLRQVLGLDSPSTAREAGE
jgi:hypothetical protein